MLHASGPSGYSLTLNVTSSAWYSGGDNWRTVGSVVDDTECKTKTGDPGWRGFHVHQDFMPPETSVESCQWNMNTSTDFHTGVTDRRRDDPDIWYTIADFRRLITLGHSRSLLLRLANPDTGTTIKAHTLESSIGIVTTNGEEVFLGATSGVAILDPGPLALTPFTTLT